jgi:hypothetical protein
VSQHELRNSVLRKILITSLVGALTFPVTNLLFDTLATQFAGAVGAGAVVLIIQFLIEVTQRLEAVEDGQIQQMSDVRSAVDQGLINVGTAAEQIARIEAGLKTEIVSELVARAAANPSGRRLVSKFAQAELERVSLFLHGLSEGEVTYDGEDRDWLLALTHSATRTIDTFSLFGPNSGDQFFQHGFWGTDLGHRYLALQGEAVRRGVRVRQIFLVERPGLADDAGLLHVCRIHISLGIEVRVLSPEDITDSMARWIHMLGFILFDESLSYEVTPASHINESGGQAVVYTRSVIHGSYQPSR